MTTCRKCGADIDRLDLVSCIEGATHTLGVSETPSFRSMSEVRAANDRAGFYWFSTDTLRFFRSRVGKTLYGGRYFVSSEMFVPSDGTPFPRKYTVRIANPDGSIDTVGEFQEHASSAAAVARIRQILKGESDA